MKRIIILSIFGTLFLYSVSIAQNFKTSDSLKKSFVDEKPISFNMTAGTAFMTGFNKTGSLMSTYFAPELNYKLKQLQLLETKFCL